MKYIVLIVVICLSSQLYAQSISANAIHGSDSNENAVIEANFHFETNEFFSH